MRLLCSLLLLTFALAATAQEPDLAAEPFQALRKACLQERATLVSARTRAYTDLLQARIDEAEKDYQEKTSLRNVKGLSVARKAKSVSEEALATVQSNGTFTLPSTIRRELDDWLKQLTADKAKIDQESEAGLTKVRAKYKEQFAETWARLTGKAAPADPELDALFEKLLATEPKKTAPPPPPPGSTNAPPAEAATNTPWFASSGEATNWFTAGRWTADMNGQDILSIPVWNVTNSYTDTKEHGLVRQVSSYQYEVVKPLKADSGVTYVYRLKRMADRQTVSLLSWPSAANRGRLEFRTKPTPRIPSPHGFELEAAVASAKTGASAGPGPVEASIDSEPAGAQIRLNDKLLSNAEGEPVLTPARLRLPPAAYTLKLTLKDHVAKTFTKWTPQNTPRIAWKFQHETALPPTGSVKLDPTKSWTASEVRVNIGDRVWIVPSGRWTIGNKGELCGPEGYPETGKFPHYYGSAAMRYNLEAPYGCLLVRFGYTMDPIAVTNAVKLQAPAQGILFFDVNEKPELRKDNRGQMTVNVIVIPFAP